MKERKIVPLAEWQLDQMAQIEQQCFSDPWSRQALAQELGSPLAQYFVCVDGENVLGYLGTRMLEQECQIVNVAVHPKHRRQGIGRQLMLAMFRYGRQHGMDQITLEVRQSNRSAMRLYESFSFQISGVRWKYYQNPQEDALLMDGSFQKYLGPQLEGELETEMQA